MVAARVSERSTFHSVKFKTQHIIFLFYYYYYHYHYHYYYYIRLTAFFPGQRG